MTNRAMSDSNVKWIGDIPNNWSVEPIGKLFTERNTKVSDLDFPPLSVTKKGIVPQLENAAKSKNHNDRKQVNSGDFVINSRSDRKMSSGLSSLDGSVSLINIVLTSKSVFPGYTKYLLKNYGFAEEFYRWGTGIVADLWSTRYERMKRILLPYPPYEEQKKIAAFLDEKISHIENIIEDTKKSIENLKAYKQSLITETVTKGLDPNVEMKNSGIEWIGKIPKRWGIEKLKFHSILDPSHKENDNLPEKAQFVPMDNIKDGYLMLSEVRDTDDLVGKYTYFRDGDIVIAKVRPSFENGNIAIASNLENNIGFGTTEIFTLRVVSNKVITEFLFYYLRNSNFLNVASSTMTGVAGLKRISSSFLRNYKIGIPDIEEQSRIVRYLDEKIDKIDSLLRQKEQIVTELESYKKSFIYEYVTGKKEVK